MNQPVTALAAVAVLVVLGGCVSPLYDPPWSRSRRSPLEQDRIECVENGLTWDWATQRCRVPTP